MIPVPFSMSADLSLKIGGFDLIRKDIILLQLYRGFKEFAAEKDEKQLSKIVHEIEEVLGLESEDEVDGSSYSTPSEIVNPLADLGKLASTIVSGLNNTAAENNISPNEMPDIGKVLGSVFENGALQGIMKNLMNAVVPGGPGGESGTPSFENAFGQVIKSLSSPEFKEAIIQTAAESSAAAVHPGPKGPDIDTSSPGPSDVTITESSSVE